jgi:predicted phage-related endonuclease
MQRHFDEPGSTAWHARRAQCFNAGDASAMLGCHPSGKTRTELLREANTGIEREFSTYVQDRVIAPGHRIESLWRPIAEEILGEDLQVIAGSLDIGLSRPLGASLDGITFMEDTLGECKSANEDLRAALPHTGRDSHQRNDALHLPKGYRVQMEQQQLVTGAKRTLFSACQFDAEGNPTEERHCWYESDPALRSEILAGWKQFDADLAAWVEPARAEVVVAAPVQALPAVSVVVTGEIAIRDNFKAFEVALRDFLEHRLIRQPKTDQDFADLDVQIKAMKGAEAALESAEAQMLAQIQTVDSAKKTKDMLAKLVRDNRLMAEKLLASEKERRRGEIVAGGVTALREHVAALNKRLGQNFMPVVPADFGAAIKGKKNLSSMEEAVATELARAKIAANEIADRIHANMQVLVDAGDAAHFPDAATLVLKATDDLRAIVGQRIAEAQRKLEEQRERIRAEEAARLQREADAEAARHAKLIADAAIESAKPAPAAPAPVAMAGSPAASDASRACAVDRVVSAPPPKDTRPPITTGALCARLGDGITLTAAFIQSLGFEPAPRPADAKSGTYWHEADFPRICLVLANHLREVAQGVAA